MNFTGERVVPQDMHNRVDILQDHLARYNFALAYVINKNVLDAACGTGYGVSLMSNVAKSVIGMDIDPKTIQYCRETYPKNLFYEMDLNKPDPFISHDVITSFETIEHLTRPDIFLDWVSKHCETFIFSIPVNDSSEFHKTIYSINGIKTLISYYFKDVLFLSQVRMNFYHLNDNSATYVVGVGRSKSRSNFSCD
jgi:2-polyprenyl-3-methyl-5-hydroxy-6-metoxy-1,4-benzoquinol methylase